MAVVGDPIRKAYQKGVDPLDFLAYNAGKDGSDEDGSGSLSIAERGKSLQNSGLSEKEQLALWETYHPKWADKAEEKKLDFEDVVQYKFVTAAAGATKKEDKIEAMVRAGYTRGEVEELYGALK